MKRILTCSIFFLFSTIVVLAQRDVVRPSYSSGGSSAGNVNNSYNNSSGSSGSYSGNSNSNNTNTYNSSGSYSGNSGSNNTNNSSSSSRGYGANNNSNNYNNDYYSTDPQRVIQDVYYTRRSTFYIRAGFGYAFSANGQTLNENSEPYSTTMNFETNGNISSYSKLKKVSFSAGIQAVGAFGWMINRYMGIEVDGYFGLAPKKYTAQLNNIMVNGNYPADITVTNKARSPIFVAPCFVLQTPGKVYNAYARAGIVIPANGKIMREETYNFSAPGFDNYINQLVVGTKITTSLTLGYTAAIGAKFKLNKNMSVWTEMDVLAISLDIKQEMNTENTVDGTPSSLFPTVNFGYTGSNVNRNNQTGTQPTYSQPFSNIALNAGIAYDF